jgi:putative colanic acid biosynthesis UDP-glucose lipid carrier transferase
VSVLVGLGYLTGYLAFFDQAALFIWIVSVPFVLWAARGLAAFMLSQIHMINGYRKAVIVGVTETGQNLARKFAANHLHGVKVLAFFDSRQASRLESAAYPRVRGGLAALPEFVKTHDVRSVYITLPMTSQPRIVKLLDELRDTTASVYFVPLLSDMMNARMVNVSGIPVVAMRDTPLVGVNAVVKRVEDLVLSVLILTLISPLLIVIALGVKLSSPGPVIFRQRRYGLDGKEIVVYKFRTMRVMEDGNVQFQAAASADPRMTPFGAFLRRTSLDELPQFVNVLQGRMSVVGPRPHVVAQNEHYRKIISGYMLRHTIKPGITGWAQIHGYRGGNDLDHMKRRTELDLYYVSHWSLTLDGVIFFRTLLFVFFGDRHAY